MHEKSWHRHGHVNALRDIFHVESDLRMWVWPSYHIVQLCTICLRDGMHASRSVPIQYLFPSGSAIVHTHTLAGGQPASATAIACGASACSLYCWPQQSRAAPRVCLACRWQTETPRVLRVDSVWLKTVSSMSQQCSTTCCGKCGCTVCVEQYISAGVSGGRPGPRHAYPAAMLGWR